MEDSFFRTKKNIVFSSDQVNYLKGSESDILVDHLVNERVLAHFSTTGN